MGQCIQCLNAFKRIRPSNNTANNGPNLKYNSEREIAYVVSSTIKIIYRTKWLFFHVNQKSMDWEGNHIDEILNKQVYQFAILLAAHNSELLLV